MATAARSSSAPAWLLPFAATLVAMFCLQQSNFGFSPLLPSIQRDTGMNFTQLGLFIGIYGLLAILLSVPAGISARRFGERRVLVAGMLVVAMGSVLLGQADSFESAISWRGLVMSGYRFAFVSVLVAVALTTPPALRGRTMGILGATSAMAAVVGAPLGGILVEDLGWRLAILGYALVSLFGAAIYWMLYPRTPVETAPAAVADTTHGGVSRSALRSPVVWLLALIVGLGGFGQFTISYFVPSIAGSNFGLDAAAAGFILSTGYLAAIVMNIFAGFMVDRFNRLAVLGVMFVCLAVASASLSIADETVFRIATAAVISIGFSAANQLYGLAATFMPRHEAGNAMGVVSLGAGLFGFLGPQLLGILRDATGTFAAGFRFVVIAYVITLGLLYLLHRLTTRRPT